MTTTTRISTAELVGVLERAGLGDRSASERVIDATIAVLGERLTVDESAALAGSLADPLRTILASSTYDQDFDAAELYERIRRRSGVNPGLAREHAQIVLEAIVCNAPDEVARRITRALPRELAPLFDARELGEAPPPAETSRQTLATGRPGSRHPVAESRPSAAHAHSVVREANPHADTKLSSGQPAPARPMSEGYRGRR